MGLPGPAPHSPKDVQSLLCLKFRKFSKSLRLKGFVCVWVLLWVDLILGTFHTEVTHS